MRTLGMLRNADAAFRDIDKDIVEVLAVLHAGVGEACDVDLSLLEVGQLNLSLTMLGTRSG